MSDVNDLASSLFGTSRAEVESGGTSTLYGTAATDSSGGSVSVRMGADTLRADGQAGTSVLVPTTTDVRAGETVIVTVVDGHPVVTGVVGSGDRLRTDVGAAASAASSAQESADSAKASADAATESATTLSRTRMLMATCDTEAATAAKAATLASGSLELRAGASVTVVFSHANTASAPTLDVGGTGARPLRTNGSASAYWADGQAVVLTYDGTYWQVCSTPVYASKVTVGNPGGSNVRIGSNSVDVRDGTDVTASFQRDGVTFLGGKYAVKTYSTALAGSSDPLTGFQVSSQGPAKVTGATSSLVGDIGGVRSAITAGWVQDIGSGAVMEARDKSSGAYRFVSVTPSRGVEVDGLSVSQAAHKSTWSSNLNDVDYGVNTFTPATTGRPADDYGYCITVSAGNGGTYSYWRQQVAIVNESGIYTRECVNPGAGASWTSWRRMTYYDRAVTPIYRLKNPYTGVYLYTSSSSEYNSLISAGWSGEGTNFYAFN